jgi:hypothetical protein
MKLAPKILAVCLLAASPFCLAGSVSALPIGMGLGLKDAASSDVETVRVVTGGRVGGVGRVGGIGIAGGRYVGAGRYGGVGRWAGGPGWRRPGYGLAAGALVGGAFAASQPWYGYGGYGNDYGASYYGDGPAYSAGYPAYAYGGYDYGRDPAGPYLPTCTYVGGPKAVWMCR